MSKSKVTERLQVYLSTPVRQAVIANANELNISVSAYAEYLITTQLLTQTAKQTKEG